MSKLSCYPISLNAKSIEDKRSEIKQYFQNTFSLFEKVFTLLKDESVFYKQSELTRHPMIFYFGHTATFFINKLIKMNIIDNRINPSFESIFAIGVDEMSWDDMDENHYKWPQLDEVKDYRVKVKNVVNKLIDELEFILPIEDTSPMWIILMGIEHERIHIETSLVLHRQMPLQYIKEVSEFTLCKEDPVAPENTMVDVNARSIHLGKKKNHHLYGWDNEYGNFETMVPAFKVSKYLVSNAEFLKFVQHGGYQNKSYWCEEGKAFLSNTSAKFPSFWLENNDGKFDYRTLSKEIPLPLSWPVEVNALEAKAFCMFKKEQEGINYSLPSEQEYRAIYEQVKLKDIPDFDDNQANLNFNLFSSSCPVNKFEFNGIYDVVGNVWQWSRTPMRAFEGFEVHEAYDDFSVPTFDENHALILGSSWASSGNLITKHSRYAFRRHFYQNAGFRYVISDSSNVEEENTKIFDDDVSLSCRLQYETQEARNISKEYALLASKYTHNTTKVLDLGCKTGATSFELAKYFDKVDGVDSSARYIQVGVQLQRDGFIDFINSHGKTQHLSIKDLADKDVADKISFLQGDAGNLKERFQSYDLIMLTNIFTTDFDSKQFLKTIDTRLNNKGILMIIDQYDNNIKILEERFELLHSKQDENFISIWRKNEV